MHFSSKRRGTCRQISAQSAKSRVRKAVNAAIETLETRTLMSTVTVTVQGNSDTVASIVTASGPNALNANTLRAAVNYANTESFPIVIQFNAAKFPGGASNTITLTSGLTLGAIAPAGSHSYKIVGPTAKPIVVSGNNLYTDFTTNAGVSAEFDTLTIAHGNSMGTNGGGVNANGPLTLVGDTFASDLTGTGGKGGGVYSATGQVTVTNSTFTGDSADNGGGIYIDDTVSGAAPTVTGSTFSSDTAVNDGGAIENFSDANSTFTVSASSFTNDSTGSGDNGGGAIFNYSAVGTLNATISTSTFSSDTSVENGGAVYSDGKSLTLTGDTFTGDKSTANYGGAVYSLDATLLASNSAFSNDVAFQYGGGILYFATNTNPSLTVTNSTFTNDSTLDTTNNDGYGGAICDFAGANTVFTITGSTFTGNKAADYGGAVYSQGGAGSILTVSGDTFTSNTALTGDGGAIESVDDDTMAITGSTFTNNSTQDDSNSDGFGGAVNSFASTLTVSNDMFAGNTAAADGGALYFEGGSNGATSATATVTNSTFSGDSSAFDGGAIASVAANSVTTALTVNGSSFANDTAGDFGGGIYSADDTLNVNNDAFTNDTGQFDGGGIYYTGDTGTSSGTANVTNSTFTNDTVPNNDEGGAIYGASITTALNVSNDTFTDNSASFDGGAIAFFGAGLNVSQSSFDGNSSTTNGGGAIITDATTVGIFDSTFNGNSTGDLGGGAVNFYGSGNASFANDTFFGNSAGGSTVGGGGLYINTTGAVTVTDSTFDGNTAGFDLGGGIENDPAGGDVLLDGDIVAGNFVTGTPGTYTDLAGTFDTLSTDNIIGDGSNQIGFTPGNVGGNFVGTDFAPIDPMLGALANNGGPTETQIPASTSLAIGNSQDFPVLDSDGNDVTLTDQTTLNARPQDQGYDIGAYQTGGAVVAVTPSVSIGAASVNVPKTGTTTLGFPVTLSATTTSAITLTYSTNGGTATSANGDYNGVTNAKFTIPAGSAAGTYFIIVTGIKYETSHGAYPKNFTVTISAATNATISNGTATGTINAPSAASPTVSISTPATVHVPASGTTTVKVPVNLTSAATSAITLTYSTIGVSASSQNGDYNGVTNATFTIPAGSPAGTYFITITGVKHETAHGSYPKTFQVKLSSATNATVVGGTETVTATLAFP